MEVSKNSKADLTAKLNLQENHRGKSLFSSKRNRLIILAVSLVVLIGIGVYFLTANTSQNKRPEPSERGWGQRPSGQPEGQSASQQVGEVPKPPTKKVSLYKGFWMPCSFMDNSCQPMNDVNLLKNMNVNIIGIAPNIKINSKGEVKSFPMDYIDKRLGEITKAYYGAGIRVFISPEVDYTQDLNSTSQGEPRPIPKDVAAKHGFTDKYDLIVQDLAKLAEKYQVEMFSPMNEPDMKLGEAVASSWGQKILPTIRSNYKGKVLWKAGLVDTAGNSINFKGYDVLGIDFTAPGGSEEQSLANYPAIVNRIVNNAILWAKRDNVSELILSEVGVWGGALKFSEEGKAKVHQIIFEQAKEKVKGFIILDDPPDLGWSIKNTKSMNEIKLWFTEKLDN